MELAKRILRWLLAIEITISVAAFALASLACHRDR
jgi:hypothetical protein